MRLESASKDPIEGQLDPPQNDPPQNDENPTLNILLKHSPPETYGAALDVGVAKVFSALMEHSADKKVLEKLKEDHKAPDNCRVLGAPRVNKEIWTNFDKNSMSSDWELRGQQELASVILTTLAKTVQFVNTNLKKDDADKLMNILSETITASFYLFKDMNQKRRTAIKRSLPRDVAQLINSDMKTTELLFGDNFAEQLKTARSAMSLTRPYRGRGSYRMQPYPNARGRGKGGPAGHFHSPNENALNSNRPPHFNRGARGGRSRPFQHNSFQKNYHHQNHQNNNQA